MEKNGSKTGLIAIIIILLAVVVVGGLYFLQRAITEDVVEVVEEEELLEEELPEDELPEDELPEEELPEEEPREEDVFTYTDDTYAFSVSFPESWGAVDQTDDKVGHEDENILETFYFETEDDEDKFFYLVVGAPDIRGGIYEDAPSTFLDKSDQYVFYYTGTMPSPACDWDLIDEMSYDERVLCEKQERVWTEDIQEFIVPNFEIF